MLAAPDPLPTHPSRTSDLLQNHRHLLVTVGLTDFHRVSCGCGSLHGTSKFLPFELCEPLQFTLWASFCRVGYSVGRAHTNHSVPPFLLPIAGILTQTPTYWEGQSAERSLVSQIGLVSFFWGGGALRGWHFTATVLITSLPADIQDRTSTLVPQKRPSHPIPSRLLQPFKKPPDPG